MNLVEKKSFSILSLEKEVQYIRDMAESGNKLVKVDGAGHHFIKGQEPESPLVVIEFFEKGKEVKDPEFYISQGMNLVSSFEASKGTWNYYTGLYSSDEIEYREDDIEDAIKTIRRRLEIFWTLITISIFFFSLYMLVQTRNPIFILMISASGALAVYIERIRRSIKSRIKK